MQQAGAIRSCGSSDSFVLGNADNEVVNGARTDGQQQHAADQLEQTVESFGDDLMISKVRSSKSRGLNQVIRPAHFGAGA